MSLSDFQLDVEWNRYKAKVQTRTRNHIEEVEILYRCPHKSKKREIINHHPDYLVWNKIWKVCRGCHGKEKRQERPIMWAPEPRKVKIWKGGLTTRQRVERKEQKLFAPKMEMSESVKKASELSIKDILKMGSTELEVK
jgi:hypothetical protein